VLRSQELLRGGKRQNSKIHAINITKISAIHIKESSIPFLSKRGVHCSLKRTPDVKLRN
jgi:hypothetical protein